MNGRLVAFVAALALCFGAGVAVVSALMSGGHDHDVRAPSRTGRVVTPPSALAPLSPRAFAAPIAAYRVYAAARLGDVARAARAIKTGAAGRARWRDAYVAWGRAAGAYDAFGDLGSAVEDGLHAVEAALWRGRPARSAARQLTASARRLQRAIPGMTITPLDYATRAHEVLEDAKTDQLGGAEVGASGAGVLGLSAATDATGEILGTLQRTLAGRVSVSALTPYAGVRALREALAEVRRAHGGAYPTVSGLTRRERDLLQARSDAALEALARVPEALETTTVTAIPPISRRLS